MTSGTAVADARESEKSSARFVSGTRVLFGSLYWLVWIIFSRRAVVTTGVARELESLGIGALRLVGASSLLVGLITMVHHIFGGIGAYLGAAVFDATGTYNIAFTTMLVVSLIAFLLSMLLGRPQRAEA